MTSGAYPYSLICDTAIPCLIDEVLKNSGKN
jgi:hypothetical protein